MSAQKPPSIISCFQGLRADSQELCLCIRHLPATAVMEWVGLLALQAVVLYVAVKRRLAPLRERLFRSTLNGEVLRKNIRK